MLAGRGSEIAYRFRTSSGIVQSLHPPFISGSGAYHSEIVTVAFPNRFRVYHVIITIMLREG
jgi:hypothetical protein